MKLWQYTLRRLLLLIPVLFGITVITFNLSWYATCAKPIDSFAEYTTCGHLENQYLDQADRLRDDAVERIIKLYGFDQPIHIQYMSYLKNLARGDLGYSTSVGQPVRQVIGDLFPASFELALVAMFFAVVLGIPVGILSATHRNRPLDHTTRFVALAGVSVPIFWLALLLQLYFSYYLGQKGFDFFPLNGRFDPNLLDQHRSLSGGPTGFLLVDTLLARDFVAFKDVVRHIVLPGFTLGFATTAVIARMMRASMLEVLSLDFVRTARAKGLEEKVVINKHARRNALIPTVTVVGLAFGGLINGAVLTETIFGWPGLGRWATIAIRSLDIAAVMTFVVLSALVYVLANLIVDLVYAILDPRVRLE